MDSGNSGSLQSSSGGDEEYDSRAADSVSAFMSSGGGGVHIPNPPPFFDPLSGYLQLHQNPNSSLLNSNLSWSRTSAPVLRSDPNQMSHELVHSMLPASTPFMPCFQPTASSGIGADSGGGGSPTVAPPLNQNQAAARNPKKRSRASRRAPTTVLTTDTTNFRAMVQEFTGIPAPPFNSSSFPRTRLDLFGSRSTSFDAAAQPPPYLRRPFAQKVQPPHPFLSSSSSLLSSAALDAIAASTSHTTNSNNITPTTAAAASSSTPSINYQLPMTQSSNPFNIPNQNILTSLLQSNPKFPFSTSPMISSKPQNSFEIPSNDDQFQVSGTLTGLPNLIPSDQIAPRHDHNDNTVDTSNAARWSNSPGGDKDDRVNLRPLHNGNYEFQRNTMSGKMSFSASSTSGFHGGKAPENVAAAAAAVRGEGMVESWICSSE